MSLEVWKTVEMDPAHPTLRDRWNPPLINVESTSFFNEVRYLRKIWKDKLNKMKDICSRETCPLVLEWGRAMQKEYKNIILALIQTENGIKTARNMYQNEKTIWEVKIIREKKHKDEMKAIEMKLKHQYVDETIG